MFGSPSVLPALIALIASLKETEPSFGVWSSLAVFTVMVTAEAGAA